MFSASSRITCKNCLIFCVHPKEILWIFSDNSSVLTPLYSLSEASLIRNIENSKPNSAIPECTIFSKPTYNFQESLFDDRCDALMVRLQLVTARTLTPLKRNG